MKIERFEDIKAWQKARQMTGLLYKAMNDSKDFRFRDQLQSASVSIMNNIAEGFERKSDIELSRFLFIAKGSCGEVRSMLYVASDLKYVSKAEFDTLCTMSLDISRMLSAFIKTLRTL